MLIDLSLLERDATELDLLLLNVISSDDSLEDFFRLLNLQNNILIDSEILADDIL